jgi:hypothetical protein
MTTSSVGYRAAIVNNKQSPLKLANGAPLFLEGRAETWLAARFFHARQTVAPASFLWSNKHVGIVN